MRSLPASSGPHGCRPTSARRASERNAENAPLHRVAQTADIAGPLLFLVSDLSSYVNGQTLTVDGGVGVKFPYPLPEGV